MKKHKPRTARISLCLCVFARFFIATAAFADGPVLSGLLDTKLTFAQGCGTGQDFLWGIEEYANLRLQSRLGDRAVFYAAFNLIALSGSSLEAAALSSGPALPGLSPSAVSAGENYAAAMELERLYFKAGGEYVDWEAGLMRLSFGYGQIWGPSDFLNPRSPLFSDARPRAVLGTNFSIYPADSLTFRVFGSGPRDPFKSGGGGVFGGLSGERHWERASVQALYAYETPQGAAPWGVHRAGLSIKADLEAGITADALYTLDPAGTPGIDGLSASIGADYSFFEGKCIILSEYLFNGSESATARSAANPAGLLSYHYLFSSLQYLINDYTNTSLAAMVCLKDGSFSPIVTIEHDLFQGMTLSLQGRVPLDGKTLVRGSAGELGPEAAGARFIITVKARLRL